MIKHMHKQGVPKTRIAAELGLDPKTVRKAIEEDELPEGKRKSGGSCKLRFKTPHRSVIIFPSDWLMINRSRWKEREGVGIHGKKHHKAIEEKREH